jgi:hypothetical protein
MLVYRVVFYPMLNQTLATVTSKEDDEYGKRSTNRHVALKTFGEEPWPVPHLLRELADNLEREDF